MQGCSVVVKVEFLKLGDRGVLFCSVFSTNSKKKVLSSDLSVPNDKNKTFFYSSSLTPHPTLPLSRPSHAPILMNNKKNLPFAVWARDKKKTTVFGGYCDGRKTMGRRNDFEA